MLVEERHPDRCTALACYRMASQNGTDTRVEDPDSFHAIISSFSMIIFSEIGDKTFLLAAILAMRHPRLAVFMGALTALALMSLLSAQLGHLLPTLLPRRWTQTAAAVLFLAFGAKMFQEGREMVSGTEKIQEEMREAEQDIEGDDAAQDGTGAVLEDGGMIPLEELEGGTRIASAESNGDAKRRAQPKSSTRMCSEATRNFFSLFLGPVFVQSFVLTFLGEWGDRSQISTIALGAAHVGALL